MQATLPRHLAAYYSALQSFDRHGAASKGAVRIAFQNLLSDAGRPRGFTVLAEQTLSLAGKRTIRVDGEVRDPYRIRHGVWEAKDSGDDLETEIRRRIERGYPTKNTIFENTRRAVLYQNGARVLEVDLTRPEELQRLLDRFFGYAEPQIHELASGLGEIIERERRVSFEPRSKPWRCLFEGRVARWCAAFTSRCERA